MKKKWLVLILLPILIISCRENMFTPKGRWNPQDPNYAQDTDPENVAQNAPVAPSDLEAILSDSGTTIILSWRDNSLHETGYVIYRKDGNTAIFVILRDDIAANTTTFEDNTIQSDITYSYYIQAVNPAGYSENSNIASVTTPSLPSVSISSTANDPTNVSPIPITITFSEAVTGFELSDITVGNGTASIPQTTDNITFNVYITPSDDPVTVTVDVAAAVAVDSAGNGNMASIQFIITFDSTAAAAPEINVKRGTTDIPSGTVGHDFGDVIKDTSSSAVTFTIENTGTADLNLTGSPSRVQISGTDATMFSVGTQPTSPVSMETPVDFTIIFSPTSTGSKTATVSIPNDDPDENPYTFTVTGNGTPALEVDYEVTVSNYPSTGIMGQPFSGEITIENIGNDSGSLDVIWTVYISTDDVLDIGSDTEADSGTLTGGLAPSAPEVIVFNGVWPTSMAPVWLIADISATDDSNSSNNTGISGMITISPPSSVFIGVGTFDNIFRSTNGGYSWVEIDHTDWGLTTYNSVASNGSGTFVAVADSGGIIYSMDDGVTWFLADNGGSTRTFNDVAYSSWTDTESVTHDTWVAVAESGATGEIWVSIDDGKTWTESAYSLTKVPYCIASDGNGKWILGASGGQLYNSTDPLQTWMQIASPSSSTITAIATDGTGIWVAGDDSGNMIYSNDGGVNFSLGTTDPSNNNKIEGIATDGNGYWIVVVPQKFAQYADVNVALWESLETDTLILYHHGGIATDGNGVWNAAGTGLQLTFSLDNGATWTDGSNITTEIHGVAAY